MRRADEVGVPVPEVQRRVGGEHVEVAPAIDVGDPGALGLGHDDRQGVVVVRAESLDELDLRLGLSRRRDAGNLIAGLGHRGHAVPLVRSACVIRARGSGPCPA